MVEALKSAEITVGSGVIVLLMSYYRQYSRREFPLIQLEVHHHGQPIHDISRH